MPSMVRLMASWYSFHFLFQEDLIKIKVIPWIKGWIFLALHTWYVGFNPMKETPKKKLIWVKLSGFLIGFWTRQVLMDIGNVIGKFV